MRKLVVLVGLLVGGCSDSVSVGNSLPLGVVGGLVVDASNQMPVAGATVQVTSATTVVTATTDATGLFQASKVPAGNFFVSITNPGFVTAQVTGFLNGAVGNFPVQNPSTTLGSIGLAKSTGTFGVRVVDQSGAPVPSLAITAAGSAYVTFSNGSPSSQGTNLSTATTDGSGLAVFMGLPDYHSLAGIISDTLTVNVPPIKVMGIEAYSFLGGSFSFLVNRLGALGGNGGSAPTIVLAGPQSDLLVLTSSIPYLVSSTSSTQPALIPPTGPITVVFNEAIEAASVRAQLLAEDGTLAGIDLMPSVSTNVLTLTPASALPAGQRFNLVLHAVAMLNPSDSSNENEYNRIAPFFVQPTSGASLSITNIKTNLSNSRIDLTFSEAVGVGTANGLAQSMVACSVYYEGVDFDADSTKSYRGEWGNGTSLSCTPLFSTIDVTALDPLEGSLGAGMPITGFGTHWEVNVDYPALGSGFGCSPLIALSSCIPPKSGTVAHLVFGLAQPMLTIRRLTGEPVTGDPQKLVFNVP